MLSRKQSSRPEKSNRLIVGNALKKETDSASSKFRKINKMGFKYRLCLLEMENVVPRMILVAMDATQLAFMRKNLMVRHWS
jgi:hypothetical protein